jgi:ABC-type sugar transport system permease subunit
MRRIKPYLYLAPAVIWILIVFIYPSLKVIHSSFQIKQSNTQLVFSLNNFNILFRDEIFWYAIKNNLFFLLTIPVLLFISILLAIVLFERSKGWKISQNVLLIPFVLAIPIAGVVFNYLLQYNGTINEILRSIKLNFLTRDWLVEENTAIPSIMAVLIWREFGFGTVLFLARLSSIDEEIIEAAMIDGAGWWQRLFRIIIPQMKTIVEFYIVILALTIFGWLFDYIYVMTGRGGLGFKFTTMDFYIYAYMFIFKHFGVAYAASFILLLIQD